MATNQDQRRSERAAKAAAGAGFEFAASVAALCVGGYFLDRWLNTSPTWTIVGALLGFVGGGYNLYKTSRRLMGSSAYAGSRRPAARSEDVVSSSSGLGSATQGHENVHVPAFEDQPRRSGRDLGMFGRAEVEEDGMVPKDEVRWPQDAPADDQPTIEDEDMR